MRRALVLPALALAFVALAPSSVRAQPADDAKTLLAKGEDAEKARLEQAALLYQKLLATFPNDPLVARAHLRLGICLAKLGKPDEARTHLREARKLGKNDPDVQREAERGLIALPPPLAQPEKKPAPAAKPAAAPARAPAPAETGPRAELQAEIDKLEAEKRDLTKRAQDLEDQGMTAEAYRLRAEMDRKVAEIERKKKQLALTPRGKPVPPKEQRREERRAEREKNGARPKLMKRRREELEVASRAALERAMEAFAQSRPRDAAAALAEHVRLRREAEQLGRKAELGQKRGELQRRLEKARAAAAAADKSTDDAAKKKAKDDVAQAEKALHDFDAAAHDTDGKAQLEQLVADMKRRGAPQYEIEERVALARRELALDAEHRQAVAALQQEVQEKKLAEPEARARLDKLDREHHRKVERLRAEGEQRVHERARAEMEKELARRAEELKKSGKADAEVEQTIAELRKSLEPKLPGKHPDQPATAKGAEPEHPRERRIRELMKENERLRQRIDELEKENAALRARKGAETATAPN